MEKQRFRIFHTYNELDIHTKMGLYLSDMLHACDITNQKFANNLPKSQVMKNSEGLVEVRRYQSKLVYCNLRISFTPMNLDMSAYIKYVRPI